MWILSRFPEEALKLLQECDAGVIAIIELGLDQARVLKQLEKMYPYCHWMPDEMSRGIAVLVRIEGTRFTSIDLAYESMPATEADIPANGIAFELYSIAVLAHRLPIQTISSLWVS